MRRALAWGFLVAALLAVAVAALFSGRWASEGRGEPPPVLAELPEFALVNRDGRSVTLADLAGRPWVAGFLFTRCALACPRLTAQMIRLGEIGPGGAPVRRVAITVDPEHDTPARLEAYAAAHGITDPEFLFLTGERERIHELATGGFKLAVDDAPPPELASELEPILHSTRLVLVDGSGRIRGYYDGSRGEELQRLATDLQLLE